MKGTRRKPFPSPLRRGGFKILHEPKSKRTIYLRYFDVSGVGFKRPNVLAVSLSRLSVDPIRLNKPAMCRRLDVRSVRPASRVYRLTGFALKSRFEFAFDLLEGFIFLGNGFAKV
ncbi:hypothetical protein [Maritimibacter sp. 55A14]|uniref:hypothetical protein n=1 Tax=Maritimibacter sp. 55A14 TaxID=2174844 RepID=UPI0011B1D2FC|nr:hypothetical protein [Maritimibacter sp. 55A14]